LFTNDSPQYRRVYQSHQQIPQSTTGLNNLKNGQWTKPQAKAKRPIEK